MDEFEAHREHLRAVAQRMLGTAAEADDAVQEAWLRFNRADTTGIRDTRAWLTTVVARISLDMLRTRAARRETPLDQPVTGDTADPEREALLAESVGLALLVVLERLTPAERLAFVLHDLFAMPFKDIAPIIDRTVPAAKMLASRARRRVRAAEPRDDRAADRRRIADAFLTAARDGDLTALLDLLDPDVIARADATAAPTGAPLLLRGADTVARQAMAYAPRADESRVGLADGAPAVLFEPRGRLAVAIALVITGDTIAAIDIIADPDRLSHLTTD